MKVFHLITVHAPGSSHVHYVHADGAGRPLPVALCLATAYEGEWVRTDRRASCPECLKARKGEK